MNRLQRFPRSLVQRLDAAAPIADLVLRLYVAKVFWMAGLTKIQSWDSTLALFEYEYAVPLLPPEMAAYVGTAVELSMPLLLAIGLAGRFAALVLFAFNVVAMISYPGLSDTGLEFHILWGLLLLAAVAHGVGKLSLDHLVGRWRDTRRASGMRRASA